MLIIQMTSKLKHNTIKVLEMIYMLYFCSLNFFKLVYLTSKTNKT